MSRNVSQICEMIAQAIGNMFAYSDLGLVPAQNDENQYYFRAPAEPFWHIYLYGPEDEFGQRMRITVRIPDCEGSDLVPEELN